LWDLREEQTRRFEEEAQLNPDEQCLGHNHEKEERKN